MSTPAVVQASGSHGLPPPGAHPERHNDADVICLTRQPVNNPNPLMQFERVVREGCCRKKGRVCEPLQLFTDSVLALTHQGTNQQ